MKNACTIFGNSMCTNTNKQTYILYLVLPNVNYRKDTPNLWRWVNNTNDRLSRWRPGFFFFNRWNRHLQRRHICRLRYNSRTNNSPCGCQKQQNLHLRINLHKTIWPPLIDGLQQGSQQRAKRFVIIAKRFPILNLLINSY